MSSRPPVPDSLEGGRSVPVDFDQLDKLVLPSLPQTAAALLHCAQDPTTGIEDLGKALELEPAIATRIVWLANSAIFGSSGEVSSVEQAVTLLGVNTVRLAILGATTTMVFPKRAKDPLIGRCWRRIFLTAIGCRLHAGIFGVDSQKAFLAGLTQDIAILLLADRYDEQYASILEEARRPEQRQSLIELERATLGIDHATIGARLLEHWRFPSDLVDAVRTHHEVNVLSALAAGERTLPVLMAYAEEFAECFLMQSEEGLVRIEKFAIVLEEADLISRDQFDRVVQKLEARALDLADLLDVEMPVTGGFHEMLSRARLLAAPLADHSQLVDAQTGLLHRDGLIRRIEQEMALAKRKHWPFSLLLIRLSSLNAYDEKGRIDESLELVQRTAHHLVHLLRTSDSVFRHSADTFCVVAGNTGLEGAMRLIERIRPPLREIDSAGMGAAFGLLTVCPTSAVSNAVQLLRRTFELVDGAQQGDGLAFEEC
ncbi:Diguanylate cyclase DosC [Planctomycetes bacterium Pan216]|uniref:Diguanylate cyclase DosC n=1 Tax=Kolteria novifilia TaxID=2527975 RepID=A0A518B9B8_9BACT|nr:Diguanylate cyclase DosC [Planctomycetes bacterium Pan216]